MKNLKSWLAPILGALAIISSAQAQPLLVTNAPAIGTFFLLSENSPPAFPFDPFFNTLPVWDYDGVFFVDDTQLLTEGGGGMALNGSINPGGGSGSSLAPSNACLAPNYFAVTYELSTTNIPPYSTTNLWLQLKVVLTNSVSDLIIHTPDTNAAYDIFGTTNLSPYVAPLNLTNWMWLTRATGVSTNFLWTNITHCAGAWFQLGSMQDDDGDGLTTAYETLVSNTSTDQADTDGDGRSDPQELLDRTDPRVFTPTRLAHFPFNDTNWAARGRHHWREATRSTATAG